MPSVTVKSMPIDRYIYYIKKCWEYNTNQARHPVFLLHIRQSSSSLPSSHSIWPLHLNRASMHRPSRQVNSSSWHARKSPTHNSHQHNKQSQTWSTINHDGCSWWSHYYEALGWRWCWWSWSPKLHCDDNPESLPLFSICDFLLLHTSYLTNTQRKCKVFASIIHVFIFWFCT